MTGFETERAAIEGHIHANFTAAPLFFENQPFDPPTDAPYVVVTIRESDVLRVSLGPNAMSRASGSVEAQVRVPERGGTSTARDIADALAAVLKRVNQVPTDGITIRLGDPTFGPSHLETGWWVGHLVCAFQMNMAG